MRLNAIIILFFLLATAINAQVLQSPLWQCVLICEPIFSVNKQLVAVLCIINDIENISALLVDAWGVKLSTLNELEVFICAAVKGTFLVDLMILERHALKMESL